ncbi:DegT/DnrJ/EryC1/StrS family aminotransferase [Qingshengfaniella alkalisoli]|uniref:Aminotransferase class I/II-fold pyridoxal phosphate-dependent enzyme n=1 Tax=Qingshengfaniella alkalisoli TaxID=2599296 RepID=A0A5B8ITH3_9RHOB|nr:aminotransferase class I/II-fold pyridoxal phosphate-dependent enzyme [Qingshengfaniella alkalisoli]QDY68743.1 aminotransferase class I/II-fold pyridoxal phosphate-dependent enzyme [Qingshengfaniella alkalisoli]
MSTALCFTGSFTAQLPIPDAGIAGAETLMCSGALHRYDRADSEVSGLERDFANYLGAHYCLAVASGGSAMTVALRAAGVEQGDRVLTNSFTLAPVPGSIAAAGAFPVFVETTEDLTIDLDDLAAKLGQAKVLLLSHMRGHICDMTRLMQLCDAHDVTVIEDCAHTMGATWEGTPSGRFGAMACYSTQSYKHINSGEGGLLVSDDAGLMARAILLSGSYMLYDRHGASPTPDAFEGLWPDIPNMSCRMDNLRAAILRPQIDLLDRRCEDWTVRYRVIEEALRPAAVSLIPRNDREGFVGSSIQFRLPDWSSERIADLVSRCGDRGVVLKWFGADRPSGFTSRVDHWRYAESDGMPRSRDILRSLLDMRISLTFSEEDCRLIAQIILEEVERG